MRSYKFFYIFEIGSAPWAKRTFPITYWSDHNSTSDLKSVNEVEMNKIISNIYENLNLSFNKAEKDIGIYKSSITKMEQAKELIEELKIKDKKKVKVKFLFF